MFLESKVVDYNVVCVYCNERGLKLGGVYHCVGEDIHSWHTKIKLSEFPDEEFNSADFIRTVVNEKVLELVFKKKPTKGSSFVAYSGEVDKNGDTLFTTSSPIMFVFPQTIGEKFSRTVRVLTQHSLYMGGSAKLYTLKY